MPLNNPIVIIEDDLEDQELIAAALKELGVQLPLLFFDRCPDALDYLKETRDTVFLILSDVNMPGMSGTTLRRLINEDPELRRRSIPFVFYSTTATRAEVLEAYELMVQGYFEKPGDFSQIKNTLKLIIDYWRVSVHPNSKQMH